ncbi:MAG: TIGR03936 family radical SAM-associated protein [Bacillota bacterium]|nr:TIGR03936 family radical SAM-associated protein [Bacillota bacterium]
MSRHRVRLRLAKEQEARFISHLDLARALERAVRRAGLPVALSEGFHPLPKLALGPPLALGATSQAEYLDLELRQPVPPQEVAARVGAALPPGIRVLAAGVPEPDARALMAECAAADYVVRVVPAGGEPEWDGPRAVADLLAGEAWVVTRPVKGGGERQVDIRPHLLGLKYLGPDGDGHRLAMRVRTGSAGGARPEEYLPALGRFARVEVERTEVWLLRNGQLTAPLPRGRG